MADTRSFSVAFTTHVPQSCFVFGIGARLSTGTEYDKRWWGVNANGTALILVYSTLVPGLWKTGNAVLPKIKNTAKLQFTSGARPELKISMDGGAPVDVTTAFQPGCEIPSDTDMDAFVLLNSISLSKVNQAVSVAECGGFT